MKMKKILKKSPKHFGLKILKTINMAALTLAVMSINSTCVWVHHQPEIPDELIKVKNPDEIANKKGFRLSNKK